MVETILKAAGLPCWPAQCDSPPADTYALYFDDVEVDGSDGLEVMTLRHGCMVEIYAPTKKAAIKAEAALEAQLLASRIPWVKQAMYWLKDIKRYQTIYEFDFIEKRRAN